MAKEELGRSTLSGCMSDFLRYRALHQGAPVESCEQYERSCRGLLACLPGPDVPGAFTTGAVNAWMMAELERGVGPRTVSSRLAHLVSLGEFLVKHRILGANPARAVERPRFHRPESKFLHPHELKAFLAVERPANESMARALFLDSMLRVSELAGANAADLETVADRTQLRVRVKGGKEKRVPLSSAVADQIRGYLSSRGELADTAPLIVNARGQRWTRTGLSQLMARIARAAGVTRFRVHAHTLRHTAASVALASGVNPLAVSKLLNHSSLSITQQYLHLAPGALDQARDQQRSGLLRYIEG